MQVVVLKVDLAIVKPDGTEVGEDKEETDGEVLGVNADDDDNDGGTGGHGQTTVVSDKDDGNGVSGENDLLAVKLHKVDPAVSGNYRLQYDNTKIAVWKQSDKTQSVQSDVTDFDPSVDTTVYVEGKSPHGNVTGDMMTLKFIKDGNTIGTDKAKVIVADSVFALFGHGGAGTAYEQSLTTYLNTSKKDCRTDPYIIKGKDEAGGDRYYSVYSEGQSNLWKTEKGAKIAIQVDDGTVVYDGHSNFGMGFAFATGHTQIRDFMNVAQDLIAINWPYLRTAQDHPNLMVADSEYGDVASTPEQYDPVYRDEVIQGAWDQYNAPRCYSTPATGSVTSHLHRAADKWNDYHQPPTVDLADPRIVVMSGSVDMPPKKWKRMFLNSCYSGPYYYTAFNHGALFFSYGDSGGPQIPPDATREFVKSVIGGKNKEQIRSALNAVQRVYDYWQF